MFHGRPWNLRKFASLSIQKVAHPIGINLQLAVETCEFSDVPSLGVHGTLMYLNLLFINEYFRTGFLRRYLNYLPSIVSARNTQRILQTVNSIESEKVHRIRKKSIVYTRPN